MSSENSAGSPHDAKPTVNTSSAPDRWQPLRTWIPMLLLPLMLLMRFIPSLVPNGPSQLWMASAFGPFLVGLLVMLWWLLVSRARWFERGLGVMGIVVAIVIEQWLCHHSMRGPLLIVMTIPMTIAGFAVGVILFGSHLTIQRTWRGIALATIACLFSLFVRTDGVWGDFSFGFAWRWQPTSEERAIAYRKDAAKSNLDNAESSSTEKSLDSYQWPAFRGPQGDGKQSGVVFSDDWQANPPKELWRIPVGPAWSSFVAAGDRLFTQEQRGENETVVCYDANSGGQIWEFTHPARFFESLGGLGPRATPTLSDGSVYALGAAGTLVRLNMSEGKKLWEVDLQQVAKRKEPPMWGFSSSPCVEKGLVIVHAGGKGDLGVLAFRAEDGQLAWSGAAGEMSYGSVQKINLLDQSYLCLLSNTGAHFWEAATGKQVLDYKFAHAGYRALQPQVIDGNKVLIPAGMGTGTRLVEFSQTNEGLTGKELWTTKDMKPDFNDVLVHKGYLYGFDNAIFACIDLKDGAKKWKGGRYEKGQALLLADSQLIVVVSERGELVLLRASPEKLIELTKVPTMNNKCWNHPVVVGDRLYLRNAEEAICYQLKTAD
jgi:outer membrane protein assembly factor BamB